MGKFQRALAFWLNILTAISLALISTACAKPATPVLIDPEFGVSPSGEPGPTHPATYQIGEIIQDGDLLICVLGWQKSYGGGIFQPEQGNIFIGIDIVLINQGENMATLIPLSQIKLKDESSQQYSPGLIASAAVGQGVPNGSLYSGERIRGQVGFQLPQTARDLVLTIDIKPWKKGKVSVTLGVEPVSVPPPADLPPGQVQPLFAVGDRVEIGDLVLSLNQVTNPAGGQFNQPRPGEQFTVIDLTITNQSASSITISSAVRMALKDSTGQVYDIDLQALVASGGKMPDGVYAPGETIRGQVGFQTPLDAGELIFTFDAFPQNQGRVNIALP